MPTLRESLKAEIARLHEAIAVAQSKLDLAEASPVAEFLDKEIDHVRDFLRNVSRHLFASQAPALPAPPAPAAAPADPAPASAASIVPASQ